MVRLWNRSSRYIILFMRINKQYLKVAPMVCYSVASWAVKKAVRMDDLLVHTDN